MSNVPEGYKMNEVDVIPVDVVAVLTNSDNPQVYWRVLKKCLIDEGSNENVTKCNGLKMIAQDDKMQRHCVKIYAHQPKVSAMLNETS